MNNKKRNQSLLWQVGVLIAVIFLSATAINSLGIYLSNKHGFDIILNQQMQSVLYEARDCLTEYRSLPWLMEYWRGHSAEMNLPGDIEGRSEAVRRLLFTREADSLRTVRPEEAESFSQEEQRLFAEACYLAIMPRFYAVEKNFGLTNLTCVTMLNRETMRPLFQGLSEGELTAYGNFRALNEEWPFNADLYPAIDEMYALREERLYVEKV